MATDLDGRNGFKKIKKWLRIDTDDTDLTGQSVLSVYISSQFFIV
ncbi:protein of unknown function [Candidatus Promineifilum breve]|uniref:Uncharacterized protein n=1 Tax=Candidatus Promineifilum breve TaxID=1806508 RepID=A0A160TA28_9CHLR|nr:protein of unknown function [Candidatus Promineifilum breve]